MMMEDRFKRLRKKARKGMRGWPMATIAFYGPNLSQATKVAVGIVPSENAEVKELRDWKVDRGDVRADSVVAREILEFMEKHGVLSVAITDAIIGCPHQEGIDYEGEWCPACEFWHGRDRGTGSINFAAVCMSASPPTPDVSLRGSEPTLRANRRHHSDLFNDLIGHCENFRRQVEAERFCGFKIDHQLELGCLHHW